MEKPRKLRELGDYAMDRILASEMKLNVRHRRTGNRARNRRRHTDTNDPLWRCPKRPPGTGKSRRVDPKRGKPCPVNKRRD